MLREGEENMIRLSQVKTGNSVVFISSRGGAEIMKRLTHMGLIPGEKIQVLHNTGHGQVTVLIKGSKLAVGHGLAQKIFVRGE